MKRASKQYSTKFTLSKIVSECPFIRQVKTNSPAQVDRYIVESYRGLEGKEWFDHSAVAEMNRTFFSHLSRKWGAGTMFWGISLYIAKLIVR